jgi:hypothetical protein
MRPPASLPPGLAARLLARRFERDAAHAWKRELVRRRDTLEAAQAAAQVRRLDSMQGPLQGASFAKAAPGLTLTTPPQTQAADEASAAAQAAWAAADAEVQRLRQQDADSGGAARPSTGADQSGNPPGAPDEGRQTPDEDEQEGEAEPGQREQEGQRPPRGLSDEASGKLAAAEAAADAARAGRDAAAAASAAAAAAAAAARAALGAPHRQYEAYLIEGLPANAAGLQAAAEAGVPLRACVLLRPAPAAAPGSAGGVQQPGAQAPVLDAVQQEALAALVAEHASLAAAVAAAPWGHALQRVAAIELEAGGLDGLWATPPCGSCVADPPWAAAATAARQAAVAAAKEAAAAAAASAAAAAAAPPPAPAGKGSPEGKPLSAGPGSAPMGQQQRSSTFKASAKDAAAIAAAAAAAAAEVPPEAVPGALELGRLLLTLRDALAPAYDSWAASARVHALPAPELPPAGGWLEGWPGAGLYRALLAGVPAERQSVPLLVHAMLEQVGVAQGHGGGTALRLPAHGSFSVCARLTARACIAAPGGPQLRGGQRRGRLQGGRGHGRGRARGGSGGGRCGARGARGRGGRRWRPRPAATCTAAGVAAAPGAGGERRMRGDCSRRDSSRRMGRLQWWLSDP